MIWFCFFVYMFYMEWVKFFILFVNYPVSSDNSMFQSTIFFNIMVISFTLFWMCGLLFPLFAPWVCFWFLFFVAGLVWLGVRMFTMAADCFLGFFDKSHSWNWFISLFMFISHFLSFLITGVALISRISVVFLIGHFLMFTIMNLSNSFIYLLIIIPIELIFAFLQSYIFMVLVRMFLFYMI